MTSTESEVKTFVDRWTGAVRAKDIDRLTSLYAPDAVYFDIVPPLRFTGAAEIRRNFLPISPLCAKGPCVLLSRCAEVMRLRSM